MGTPLSRGWLRFELEAGGSHAPADKPSSGWMRVNKFANSKNTIGPTTPQPAMPIQFATDGENGSHTRPVMQMTPETTIRIRVAFCSLPPRKTGAAISIESAKNQSQAKVSIVCGRGGQPGVTYAALHMLCARAGDGQHEQGKIHAGGQTPNRIMNARAARLSTCVRAPRRREQPPS